MTIDEVFASLSNNILQLQQGLADMQGAISSRDAQIHTLQTQLATPFQTNTDQQTIVNRVNELSGVIASQVPHA